MRHWGKKRALWLFGLCHCGFFVSISSGVIVFACALDFYWVLHSQFGSFWAAREIQPLSPWRAKRSWWVGPFVLLLTSRSFSIHFGPGSLCPPLPFSDRSWTAFVVSNLRSIPIGLQGNFFRNHSSQRTTARPGSRHIHSFSLNLSSCPFFVYLGATGEQWPATVMSNLLAAVSKVCAKGGHLGDGLILGMAMRQTVESLMRMSCLLPHTILVKAVK